MLFLRYFGKSVIFCDLCLTRQALVHYSTLLKRPPLYVTFSRNILNSAKSAERGRKYNTVYYIVGTILLAASVTYASVPLYRMFCQAQGLGGRAEADKKLQQIQTMEKVNKKLIRVKFNADTQAALKWKFVPQQEEIWVHPGETALAFYRASNPSNEPIVGISTYNVLPFEAGLYFAKIQCFCFEEQLLNPGETVDMPVFFYIDPSIMDDPRLYLCDEIVLSYTFFESRQGLQLPKPLTPEDRNVKLTKK